MSRKEATVIPFMDIDALYKDEEIIRFVLDNGLTVILKPDPRHALVSVQYWVKTGSIHEGAFLGSGISHFLEHLMFKGTSSISGREIQQKVYQLGGDFNAYTSFDRTVYYIDGPAESSLEILDILSMMMKDPVFPVTEVEKEKGVILREIDMRDDDPNSVLFEKLFATAFREHPYKYPIIGYKDLFLKLGRAELLEYYRARYVPNNMVLVMAGDFNPGSVEENIRKQWESIPRGFLEDPVIAAEHPIRTRRAVHDYGDYQITRGVQVVPIPGFSHEDSQALGVLADIIGSGESSILWQQLRQKKFVHEVYASAWNTGTTGLFYTGLLCDPEKRDRALKALEENLKKIQQGEGITESLVQQVVHRSIAREIRSRVQVRGQAGKLGVSECVAGDIYYTRNALKRLTEIQTEDVHAVAQRWLDPEQSLTLTLSPRSLLKQPKKRLKQAQSEIEVKKGAFSNGLRWVALPDHTLPLCALGYMGLGGPGYERTGESGISSLVSTLLAKDTSSRTDQEIVSAIEAVGGSFYGNCGNNTFSLTASCLKQDLPLAVELLRDGLTESQFTEETFELEKEAQLASIQEDEDDLVTWSLARLRNEYFKGHPFANVPLGKREDVATFQRNQIVEQWDVMRDPENGVLLIAGDLDVDATLAEFESVLGKRTEKSIRSLPPLATHQYQRNHELLRLNRERQQAIVMHALPTVGPRSEEDPVDSLLVQMLSGMASHLFERVREEQGLAYFVTASRLVAPDWGMFYFYAGTEPGSADRVMSEYQKELERLASGKWGEQEIRGAKASLRSSLRMRQQSLTSRITDAGVKMLFKLPLLPWNDYDQKIGRVSREQICQRAEILLNSPSLSMIVEP